MKTTQIKVVGAYIALMKLADKPLNGKTAMALFRLKNKLSENWDFQRAEQEKYIKEFGGKVNDDGKVTFESAEDAKAFDEKLSEISGLEVEVDVPKIEIEYENLELSMADIEALSAFVKFVEKEA